MDKTPLPIEFSIRTVTIEDAPFQLMINTALLHEEHRQGYSWNWMLTLKAFDLNADGIPTDVEKSQLIKLMQTAIQKMLDRAQIQIVGTTLYQGIYEVIFYSKAEDSGEIKEMITALPDMLTDREGRFVKYQGNEDVEWEKVSAYFEVFSTQTQ